MIQRQWSGSLDLGLGMNRSSDGQAVMLGYAILRIELILQQVPHV